MHGESDEIWPPSPILPPPADKAGEGLRPAERVSGMVALCTGALGAAFLVCPNVVLAAHRWGLLAHFPWALLTQLTVVAAAPLLVALFTGLYGRRTLSGKVGIVLVYVAGAFMLLAPQAVYWPDHSGARF